MTLSKIKSAVRAARMRLAKKIAPAGADVHNPDDTVCPSLQGLLTAVFYHQLTHHLTKPHPGQTWLLDVTEDLGDLRDRDLIERQHDDWNLTPAGERELAWLWGPGRVPPWGGTLGSCDKDGYEYDVEPGDFVGCPKCKQRRAEGAASMMPWAPW